MSFKYLFALAALLLSFNLSAQDNTWKAEDLGGLKFRSIGPALSSGRIADIAIHPENAAIWYVAVGSGGVWKTENAGTTWKPIFDGQASYSIGCVTIDPNNPSTIWVGTGENVGGRHVGYGDGIYRSQNGGTSWENMGLKESEHISKIIVHPTDPNTIWVAVQGPLWSKGGERGFYKSTDGGATWKKTLGDDEWTGVTDILIDPRVPNRLYAATWQHHRNVASYMGGGPESGLHRSLDGGETWAKLKDGLPEGNMGKIGLAISPQQPDVLYAAIELDQRKGGLYRSADRGGSWAKMSDEVSGGTGPHYYQELYADPYRFDRIYLMSVWTKVSDNGGKDFRNLGEDYKHSDNHAMAFFGKEGHYLMGCDGGMYETFDDAKSWRFYGNLPVTQFYKVAVDDALPFYNVFGGTQDNYTQGGPSRTDKIQGIQNSDWRMIMGGDGHQPATEPGNPDIMYAQWQQGHLNRIDMLTGERMNIRPMPEDGEPELRFNWDAPILVSPHSPSRIYFAGEKLFRSEDRGDEWTAISGDLTRNQERFEMPIMGKKQSINSPWDVYAMGVFNTITSIAESPVQQDLLYVGTDDGLVQISENGGGAWRKVDISSMPDAPKNAYVNDIKADLFDASTVYVALDAHKYGDFQPLLYVSRDKGKSWKKMVNGIPEKHIVWRLVQDHVNKDLLFIGTEFGVYFSKNGGQEWMSLKGGMPTIAVRDLTIHRRDNDLVVSTFGRSFYILDDLSPLRELGNANDQEATLYSTPKAWWYHPKGHVSFSKKPYQGAQYFMAENPPFGAVFTYQLKDGLKTKEELRKEAEKELTKEKADIPFPGWAELEAERTEARPKILLTIKDANGSVVRRLEGPRGKGFHRVAWDLKYASTGVVTLGSKTAADQHPSALMAAPGSYTVTLSKEVDGVVTDLSAPSAFQVKRLHEGALKSMSDQEVAAFFRSYEATSKEVDALYKRMENAIKKGNALEEVLKRSTAPTGELDKEVFSLQQDLSKLDVKLNGERSKDPVGERKMPNIRSRMWEVGSNLYSSNYGPTKTSLMNMEVIRKGMLEALVELDALELRSNELEGKMKVFNAPAVEGR